MHSARPVETDQWWTPCVCVPGRSSSTIFIGMRECNWLQGLECYIDASHYGFLHAGAIDPDEMPGGTFSKYVTSNRAPQYAVLSRDYGTVYGAYCPAEQDSYYWRIAHVVFS